MSDQVSAVKLIYHMFAVILATARHVLRSPKGPILLAGLLVFTASGGSLERPLQFDVFLGYDGIIPDASWFPVVCEIKNDGPAFSGMVEVTSGDSQQGQSRRALVELPTGTLKRLVIPVFSSRGYSSWDVRLFDDRGRMRAEQPGLRPRKQLGSGTTLVGCLPRTVGGAPVIRPILSSSAELQPASARFQPQIFPDNPLVLEGMDALYLNSEKASDLKDNQVNALLGWLNSGGHLIVGVEQIADVTSSKWLRSIFPVELKELQQVSEHPELQEWIRAGGGVTNRVASGSRSPGTTKGKSGKSGKSSGRQNVTITTNAFNELPDDMSFEAAQMQVATGPVRDGRVMVSAGDTPLIVTANRGRGQITALLFSPEREPMRSWKNLPTFWARITEVPPLLYASADINQPGYAPSSDGIFGAMLDTKQVHKLPVEWLLLLLIVYLVVIGPLDQFWLKRIGRPMLTWITFPCYVVFFSLLIYFIGYKLRAGESEWNELHIVDVLFNAERAELRGRTYASVYSPANQKYNLESQQKFATVRGELLSGFNYGGSQTAEKATFWQSGDSFKAEIFVPVWTSQLFVSDWWQSTSVPVNVALTNKDDGWEVKVENRTDHPITNAQIAIEGWMFALGDVPAKQNKTFTVSRESGVAMRDFVSRHVQHFQGAVQSRQRAFGDTERGRLTDLPNSSIAASLISQMGPSQNQPYMGQFITPPGLDLSHVLDHGNAILFAWAADYSPIKAINQFSPRRLHRDTLFRVGVPVP